MNLHLVNLTYRNLSHLYTLTINNQKEKYIILSKRIKYLGINLPKEVKEKYSVLKDTDERNEDDTDGKICHVLGLKESISLK